MPPAHSDVWLWKGKEGQAGREVLPSVSRPPDPVQEDLVRSDGLGAKG